MQACLGWVACRDARACMHACVWGGFNPRAGCACMPCVGVHARVQWIAHSSLGQDNAL